MQITKWGPGGKIWDWYIIQYYFAEYLTPMLTLGLRSYRSSNLALDLKMWEKLESNLPVCSVPKILGGTPAYKMGVKILVDLSDRKVERIPEWMKTNQLFVISTTNPESTNPEFISQNLNVFILNKNRNLLPFKNKQSLLYTFLIQKNRHFFV